MNITSIGELTIYIFTILVTAGIVPTLVSETKWSLRLNKQFEFGSIDMQFDIGLIGAPFKQTGFIMHSALLLLTQQIAYLL